MKPILKSHKLDNVLYDIRGPVLKEAQRLEEEGYSIAKLHIGNPAPFGFDAPEEIIHDIVLNMKEAQGYCDSKGLFSARKAVMQHYQALGVAGVEIDDIYIGNGVSELIAMATQGLLNSGNEILIPCPDYPLWTAAANLSGGTPVHYRCDEGCGWLPDLNDIRKKVTHQTRAIVIINPNNPTGAVYPPEMLRELVEIARQNRLVIFADEIYDKILYEGSHTPLSTLAEDLLVVTFNGLSKAYRAAGLRAGWMMLSGNKRIAEDYVEGLDMLASMRLCSNVPAQFGIQTALGGRQSIKDLVLPGGRLRAQRDTACKLLNEIPGVECVEPAGALYLFPKIDVERFGITDDRQFVLDLLKEMHVLVVQGTGFNWPSPDHFRIVFLPSVDILEDSIKKIGHFLSYYRQN